MKSFLISMGYDVIHVELGSIDSCNNSIFKVHTIENIVFVKIHDDHPLLYYNTDHKQIEKIAELTKYLSMAFNMITAPVELIYDIEIGYVSIWP